MKIINVFLLLLVTQITIQAEYHSIYLSSSGSTIDNVKLSSSALYGVTESSSTVKITQEGTYVLSGEYTGQVYVALGSSAQATLVLSGVSIKNTNGPGILFTGGKEIDSSSSSISMSRANSLDFSNAGAKIIIADDTTNTVNAGSTSQYDGAVYSVCSMKISGETKSNGVLTIVASSEGLDTEKHLLIEGGVINIAAQDDGINVNQDSVSACIINGGKVLINAGLGREGDGIDSNGIIVINGGEVYAASNPGADSGLDSNNGLFINGGKVVGVGSSMDGADDGCEQPSMNLIFSSTIQATSVLTVKDSSGNELISFSPSTAGFVSGTTLHYYGAATVSHPDFKLNTVYYLYLDGSQVGYTGNTQQGPGGWGGGGQWGPGQHGGSSGSSGTMKTEFVFTSNMMYFSGIAKSS